MKQDEVHMCDLCTKILFGGVVSKPRLIYHPTTFSSYVNYMNIVVNGRLFFVFI
jgi:hypothetical protein